MDDIAEYSVLTDKGMKCSCKVDVKEAEKKPELKLDKTDFQGDANRPLTIEIPYKGIYLKRGTVSVNSHFNGVCNSIRDSNLRDFA